MTDIERICRFAKESSRSLRLTSAEEKNHFLEFLADWLSDNQNRIISENEKDISSAKQAGLNEAMIDRLTLNSGRIEAMASDLHHVEKLG